MVASVQSISAFLLKIVDARINIPQFVEKFVEHKQKTYDKNYLSILSFDDIITDVIQEYIFLIGESKDVEILLKIFDYGRNEINSTPYALWAHTKAQQALSTLGHVGQFIGWWEIYATDINKSPKLRGIINDLVQNGDFNGVDALVEIFLDNSLPDEFRENAFSVLPENNSKVDRACSQILAQNPPESLSNAATLYLGKSENLKVDEILKILQTSSESTHIIDAAKMLGDLGDPKAIDPLAKLFKNAPADSSTLRNDIVQAIGKIGGERAIEPLIEAMLDKYFHAHFVPALLVNIGAPAVEPLIDVLENHYNSYEAQYVVEALGKIGDHRAVKPLITAVDRSESESVRRSAIDAVIALRDHISEYINILIRAFEKESDGELKRDIAYKLGDTGDPRVIDPLIGQLSDSRIPGSWRMVEALVKIGDPRVVDKIKVAVENDSELLPHRGAFPKQRAFIEKFLGLDLKKPVAEHKKISSKIYKPVVCLKCGYPFVANEGVYTKLKGDEMRVEDSIGIEGSELSCSKCGELHEYQVDKEKLTLKFVTVPVGYKGSSSKIIYPSDSLNTKNNEKTQKQIKISNKNKRIMEKPSTQILAQEPSSKLPLEVANNHKSKKKWWEFWK